MDNATGLSYSKIDNASVKNARTGARTIDDNKPGERKVK